MKALNIYLAGRCKGLPDGGSSWRETAQKILNLAAETTGSKVNVFDPTKFFDYQSVTGKSQHQVKAYYMSKLRKCDVVLVNCNGSDASIGTAQEIQYAVDHEIPVIGFGTEGLYPWITEVDCQVVFNSLHEAADYIRDYYIINAL